MKIGLAQINTTVGDLTGNRQLILDTYQDLVQAGAELVVFPELAVCGYPPRDLLFKKRFVADTLQSAREIAAEIGSVPAVLGTLEENPSSRGRQLFNAAAWCEAGEIRAFGRKCLLPSYDVFDEDRYFEPASQPTIHSWRGIKVGLTICEDLWNSPNVPTASRYSADPVAALAQEGIELLINLSASPWHWGKGEVREKLVTEAGRRCGCPVVYCNLVGGNDELIFDGRSMVTESTGEIVAGLSGFQEERTVVDLEAPEVKLSPSFRQEALAGIHDALVLGLRDYGLKSGFSKAVIGLSGGIDSALVAALAADAFGPKNVIGISLPSSISSEHSKSDARELAENLGIRFETLPIKSLVEAAEQELAPVFEATSRDVTEENIQARARGLLLMAVSNKFGHILLTTGNKSEMAVGYCTLYGDMAGGLAVISDLPKMQVYALCKWYNREQAMIPENIIEKPPSAELSPDQKDEDSLPPYPILDAILERYVEGGESSAEIIEAGYETEVVRDVVRKVDRNEYKRKQAPPGLKITTLAFGVGRRIPIVQRYVS